MQATMNLVAWRAGLDDAFARWRAGSRRPRPADAHARICWGYCRACHSYTLRPEIRQESSRSGTGETVDPLGVSEDGIRAWARG